MTPILKYKKTIVDEDLALQVKLSNQTKVAKYCGVSSQYICESIRGKYTISENLYLKIKDYFTKPRGNL